MKFSLLLSAISATALAAPVAVVGNVGLSHPDPDTIAVRDESVAVSSSLLERAASFLTASLHKTKKIAVEVRQADGPERETIPPMFVVSDENFSRVRVYYREDIERALSEGNLRRVNSQPTLPWGRSGTTYPHQYNDFDRRIRNLPNIPSQGPFYEYPLIRDHGEGSRNTYRSGNPGADRVIFDDNGNFVTIIAHTFARNRNDFYPGHAAEYTLDGGNLQLARTDASPGNNPDYPRFWAQVGQALRGMIIQGFKVRGP